MSSISDVIMEKLMLVLAKLVEQWWWTCPVEVWDQLLMLAAAIFCGVDSETVKGKNKTRDDETKRATAYCLKALLRRRVEGEEGIGYDESVARFKTFASRANQPKILSILGQTLTSLLETAQSQSRSLQTVSFELIKILLEDYFHDQFFPSVLPGVVSAMVKVALGRQESKGWSPGDNVVEALNVMQTIIVAAISDDICIKEGAIRTFSRLDELNDNIDSEGRIRSSGPSKTPSSPFSTPRTSAWLRATASQLHIAINTLSPLVHHPNPNVPCALARFSYTILSNTTQTLPDAQQHLLTYLLSLSTTSYPDVEKVSKDYLLKLFSTSSPIHHQLLQVLFRIMRDRLISLPQLIPARNDNKVEQIAKQVTAACYLAESVPPILDGISKLLGPMGGIEKWGWSFLSALQFVIPPLFVSTVQPAVAFLEGTATISTQLHPFPELNMKFIELLSAQDALDTMFRALGKAAGTDAIFAVEWFIGIGLKGRSSREVSAFWCASKLLEGMGDVSLRSTEVVSVGVRSQTTLEKTSRWIAKNVAQLWDSMDDDDDGDVKQRHEEPSSMELSSEADNHLPLQYVKGLNPIVTLFDTQDRKENGLTRDVQSNLHKVLALHLLSIVAGILGSQFTRLLLQTLYPILRSLISDDIYVSSTGLASLHYIAFVTGYASPSNLLLANFDYALDGVGRRLDRRNLDPEATKIFVVMIRLVGKDIVQRASDVVEACFDRLDEYHGYTAIVESLVEVLAEVVQAIEVDHEPVEVSIKKQQLEKIDYIQNFVEWYKAKNDSVEDDQEDYGRAPREDWSKLSKGKGKELDDDPPPEEDVSAMNQTDQKQLTPTQTLTEQIVSHSIYFLTHPSPLIRARILGLLDTASPTLVESAILPTIHNAWPYILNRLDDSEPYVVASAASLIASLAEHVGEFMGSKIWKDIWPRFLKILNRLEQADSQSALSRRGYGSVGTESAYSHSHRLYRSLLRTMISVGKGMTVRNDVLWETCRAFRRFLHVHAHPELQACARELYSVLSVDNYDVVWLILCATVGKDVVDPTAELDLGNLAFLKEAKWDIEENARVVLSINVV
ncbi:hypothetical protein Clacol_007762 [Clathrus columnatus]|uniref:Uncharacterized protein n=1 Tax=Clathrus columnatus TaxID=1419009 RepID=A0AAV5AK87_9AGAM|nr:hypothetical protein Clacol_007762 [Clathrus columnatus]